MRVMFAVVCDHCGTRGEEYGGGLTCRICLDDVCEECSGDHDEESGRATCLLCGADEPRKEGE